MKIPIKIIDQTSGTVFTLGDKGRYYTLDEVYSPEGYVLGAFKYGGYDLIYIENTDED